MAGFPPRSLRLSRLPVTDMADRYTVRKIPGQEIFAVWDNEQDCPLQGDEALFWYRANAQQKADELNNGPSLGCVDQNHET